MRLALLDFVAADQHIKELIDIGVDQVFFRNGAPAGSGHRHAQARLAQALQHLHQAFFNRHAVLAHAFQL
jgi:hypothetical protein